MKNETIPVPTRIRQLVFLFIIIKIVSLISLTGLTRSESVKNINQTESRLTLDEKISIRASTLSDLELITGISEVTARKLKSHKINKIEDLLEIKGIGSKKSAKLEEFLLP